MGESDPGSTPLLDCFRFPHFLGGLSGPFDKGLFVAGPAPFKIDERSCCHDAENSFEGETASSAVSTQNELRTSTYSAKVVPKRRCAQGRHRPCATSNRRLLASMSFLNHRFERESSPRGESGRTGPCGKPPRVEPVDFGEEPQLVRRALDLNRQLLYETGVEVRFDRRAVEEKVDELLDRLLALRQSRSSR